MGLSIAPEPHTALQQNQRIAKCAGLPVPCLIADAVLKIFRPFSGITVASFGWLRCTQDACKSKPTQNLQSFAAKKRLYSYQSRVSLSCTARSTHIRAGVYAQIKSCFCLKCLTHYLQKFQQLFLLLPGQLLHLLHDVAFLCR